MNQISFPDATSRLSCLSPDGYIRLRLENLRALPLVHLFSQQDGDLLQELRAQTLPAEVAGYCEWTSETVPAVSMGWDWFVDAASERMLPAPERVRSNVMLIDVHGYDLGPQKTAHLINSWLHVFEWQQTVTTALNEPVASC